MPRRPIKQSHSCSALKEWCADPRSPIERDSASRFYLSANGELKIRMLFCPFCGASLSGNTRAPKGRGTSCRHLAELARKPRSPVVYRPEWREYWLAGTKDLLIRLFYCPLCGAKVPLGEQDERVFLKPSQRELAGLKRRLKGLKSLRTALQQLGPPDVDQGPWAEDLYPQGERTRVGCKRALFYMNLARTVTVAVVEWLDGTVDVKFYPKAKRTKGSP